MTAPLDKAPRITHIDSQRPEKTKKPTGNGGAAAYSYNPSRSTIRTMSVSELVRLIAVVENLPSSRLKSVVTDSAVVI